MIKIYDTKLRQKVEFQPKEPGKISMYVCGPTVYNRIHIGNARTFISFDVIRRYLIWRGFDVTFVQNVTDVDDKIIKKANEEGIMAYGPFSPDGYFGLSHYEKFDATLAMYHDQGLAPFKALSFEDGVNFTAGLPVVRTSPDHGTAFEMAGHDEADPLSMRAAIFTAVDIWRNRRAWKELQEGKMEKRELADAPKKERPGKPQIA